MAAPTGRLAGRNALITGASRGIGAAIARRYAAEGAQVILTARTTAGLEEVDDVIRADSDGAASATLVPLDLRDAGEIERLAQAIAQRFGRLDVLVGNAGLLGTMTPLAQIEPDEFAEVMTVNLTANWWLIRALEPLLLAAPAPRAIFVTTAAAGGRAYWGTYAISKTALEAMARTWAEEMANTALRINFVDPGPTRTAMRGAAYPAEDPMTLPAPDEMVGIFVELAEVSCTRHGERLHAQNR